MGLGVLHVPAIGYLTRNRISRVKVGCSRVVSDRAIAQEIEHDHAAGDASHGECASRLLRRFEVRCHHSSCAHGLTVKLRSRAPAPDGSRGRTLSPRARGAKPLTPHGPVQRLLGIICNATDEFIEHIRTALFVLGPITECYRMKAETLIKATRSHILLKRV